MTSTTPTECGLDPYQGIFSSESDQACIALGANLLHDELGNLLRDRFQGDQRALLQSGGPLGALATRIQLTHALAWISDEVRDDLHRVLAIKERSMPGNQKAPFTDCITSDFCGALKVAEVLLGDGRNDGLGVHDGISPIAPPVGETAAKAARYRFEVTVELIARHLKRLPA